MADPTKDGGTTDARKREAAASGEASRTRSEGGDGLGGPDAGSPGGMGGVGAAGGTGTDLPSGGLSPVAGGGDEQG